MNSGKTPPPLQHPVGSHFSHLLPSNTKEIRQQYFKSNTKRFSSRSHLLKGSYYAFKHFLYNVASQKNWLPGSSLLKFAVKVKDVFLPKHA